METIINNQEKMLELLQALYAGSFSPTGFDWGTFFGLRKTGELFSTKFYNYGRTTSGIGEFKNDSVGLVCEPSTETVKGRDDFAKHNAFWWCYCNFTVDENGVKIPTAIEGQSSFKRTGNVDVGVLTPPLYYGKEIVEDGYIWHFSDSEHPAGHPELTLELMPHCKSNKMEPMPYGIVPAYYAGTGSDGKLYGSSGLAVKNFIGYTQLHDAMTSRGPGYVGGGSEVSAYLKTFLRIKYGILNQQSKFRGHVDTGSYQYKVSEVPAEAVNYVVLTRTQAATLYVGFTVSIGTPGVNTNLDRGQSSMYKFADHARITKIEDYGTDKSKVYVDVAKPFQNTTDTYLSSEPLHSGQTDHILGSDGYVANDGKHSFRIQGVEEGIGAYSVSGNELMEKSEDGKTLTFYHRNGGDYNAGASTPSGWKNIGKITRPDTNDFWIGEEDTDLPTGASYPTTVGGGDSTGIGDRCYFGGANNGMREKLERGYLGGGLIAGLSFLHAWGGVSGARWYCAVRVS